MHYLVLSTVGTVRRALIRPPSLEDAASVVGGTSVGAFVTATNAVIYAMGTYDGEGALFLTIWLMVIFTVCLALTRRSRKAGRKQVVRVSPRAARKLVVTSVLFALPWAVLPVYVIGFHGPGQPLMVLLICTGMLSGGTFMLHRTLLAAVSYMATILLAVIFSFHFGAWEQAWPVTACAVVYVSFLAYFAFTAGETARQRDESVAALSGAVLSLRQARDENFRLANIDDTTGLLNRKAFNECLRAAVERHHADGSGFSVLLMDLDRFKHVNDLFGHAAGDGLLAEVANRLRQSLSEQDVIGRLGGDEFAVILSDAHDEHAVRAVADRLVRALRQPADLCGRRVQTGASIGAAICPRDAVEPSNLLLRADLALIRAKEAGRGQGVLFEEEMHREVLADDRTETDLRAALDEKLLHIEYQPKVDLRTGALVGAEALVRWMGKDGVSIPPDRFLSIAADRGLLPRLSRTIAETVAKDILSWRRASLDPGKIALNLHPDDIKSLPMLTETLDMFEAQGIDGRDLILEITEGCFIGRGTDGISSVLTALSARGYELSLDDFGTGHASLAHLKKIPAAEIKIDRSFMAGITNRPIDRAIVAAIAEIARTTDIRAVAEGVESEAERRILIEMGIGIGQGFLWSRPLRAEAFAELLRTGMISQGNLPPSGSIQLPAPGVPGIRLLARPA